MLLTLFNLKSGFLPCLWPFSSQTKDTQLWFLWLALISTRAGQIPSFYAIRIYFPPIIPFVTCHVPSGLLLTPGGHGFMIRLPWGNFLLSPLSFPSLGLPRPEARESERPTYLLQLLAEGISIHRSGLTGGARWQQQSLGCVIWVPADSLNPGACRPWGQYLALQYKQETKPQQVLQQGPILRWGILINNL